MKVRFWPYNSPFIYPFTVTYGTKTHQPALVVELEHRGVRGYGEAPAISYYNVTVENMLSTIRQKSSLIEKFAFTEPERYWHFLHHLLPNENFLVCALDIAAWDIFGKMMKKPLYQLWGYDFTKAPLTDYTIGIDTLGKMLEKMEANPWPIYKIKLGTPEDISIIKAIRERTSSRIRVDANAGWNLEDALRMTDILKDLDIEFIEQPLAKDDWEGMKKLFAHSRVPLFADESCVTEKDVDKCQGHFHGINIKLTKCSGITPARRMIAKARELGLQVMLGCMNETTIGTAALAHLLPSVDYADMDGPLLLATDIATGISFSSGKVSVSDEPGLGIRFIPPAEL